MVSPWADTLHFYDISDEGVVVASVECAGMFPAPPVTVLLKETEHSVGFVERSGKEWA